MTRDPEVTNYFLFADYWRVDARGTVLLPLLNGLNVATDLTPRYPNFAFKLNSFWERSADLLPLVIGE